MSRVKIKLKDWYFYVDEDKAGFSEHFEKAPLSQGEIITIPHTWNVDERYQDYKGLAWYECTFDTEDSWIDKRLSLYFHAVYRDADVWLNGEKVFSHYYSGYTPFSVEITPYIQWGRANRITVSVQNHPSEDALPYARSFDWADDGGIYRDVDLIVTNQNAIENIKVTSIPEVSHDGVRKDHADVIFSAAFKLHLNEANENLTLEWELCKGCDGDFGEVIAGGGIENICNTSVSTEEIHVSDILLWHFDSPEIYTLKATLLKDSIPADTLNVNFGFRDFSIKEDQLFLNGENVRLCGTEWMPGSDPKYGMAESPEQIIKTLKLLKESNCIFTRFHWQQDSTVYDWCDRNGMLVQEEIPFWGPEPGVQGEKQLKIAMEQAKEMVDAHYNHPSIYAWGVGNELKAQEESTHNYIREAMEAFKGLDQSRTVNYVSNTWFAGINTDGAVYGDMIFFNDYIGTWNGDKDQMEELRKISEVYSKKPLVPSEFGLCESAFSGGDNRRAKIFLEKMHAYRQFSSIAAVIYFCLNDYRTQIGEEDKGMQKKRVHGSTDIYLNPKPSYYVVKKEFAPCTLDVFPGEKDEMVIKVKARNDIPSYTMKGYHIDILQNDGTLKTISFPDLVPGTLFVTESGCSYEKSCAVSVKRPTGEEVLTFTLH